MKGGQSTTSTPSRASRSSSMFSTSTIASSAVVFIFQLPAMIGVRLIVRVSPRRQAGCGLRAPGERLHLEDAHWPVPYHGARLADHVAVSRGCCRADVEDAPAIRH